MNEFERVWDETSTLINIWPRTLEIRKKIRENQAWLQSYLDSREEAGEFKGNLVTHSPSPELKAVGGPSEVGHT